MNEYTLPALLWLGEKIPGGFFIYRAETPQEIVYVNRSILRIFGCDTEEEFKELTGNTFKGLVYPEDFEAVQASIDKQIADDANENLDYVEYRIVRKNGDIRWVDDYGHFADLPGIGKVYYVFIWDVTERKQAQEERFQMELALEQEKRRSSMRQEFIFNLSHDLRTPLNSVIGFTELAQKRPGEKEYVCDCLKKAGGSAKQLLGLLDGVLEMNGLGARGAELKSERADIKAELESARDIFTLPAREKGIELELCADIPADAVLTDKNALRRILVNLLDNAVKFTPAGGKVALTVKCEKRSPSGYQRYIFTVSDTGEGMDKDFMSRMFEPFEREQTSTASGKQGMGLGLSIVKGLCDALGGTVKAESQKGAGSVFTVELPLKLAPEERAPEKTPEKAAPSQNAAAGGLRVLIVEDIEINRMLAEDVLEEAGFITESAPDGSFALEAVRNSPPYYYDFVLMDIQMPVMNGYEATRAIRALPREDVASLPIVALSANVRDEDKKASIESGMNAHISKPFDADELIETVKRYALKRREKINVSGGYADV
ncbi:MAG: response regulator [Clostridia bacterium]|nr:response regulator [Clostridia bacterium]